MSPTWSGVLPAITTPFAEDLSIDHRRLAAHCERMLAAGCAGVIPSGSLGEGATLRPREKLDAVKTCVAAVGGGGAVVPGVAALSTSEAVELARGLDATGCDGLMVLPPYSYSTDWRETRTHVAAVLAATGLPCMLYNNPVAYGTDFLPEQVAELAAQHTNLEALKESSGDVRRITELRRTLGDRLTVLVGVDDLVVEGVAAGAEGWVAGLVNAFPDESVNLFGLAVSGHAEELRPLYEWFLPLLRLDTKPKLVQFIKLAQELVGDGPARVRPPRLPVEGDERRQAVETIEHALSRRPVLA